MPILNALIVPIEMIVLDCYLFNSLTEVREITDSWMIEYNYERPHESLNDLPPKVYEQLTHENSI